ncbi:hypothetical protein ACFUR9_40165, partial [Streptomyces cinereoruber]
MGGVLGDVRAWAAGLGEVHERFVHRFARSEPRESALAYMRGLIAPLELIDRRLYLPTSWTDDRERCRAAGIEDTVAFE